MSEYSTKQLRRTDNGRMIAGVCSGIGEYVGIDPNLVRIGLAITTLFGGLGVGLYAIGWLLVPEAGQDTSIVQNLLRNQNTKSGWQSGTEWNDHKPQQ
jgi:phage shock protein PspC (stress-responsive transcriptional regulator)